MGQQLSKPASIGAIVAVMALFGGLTWWRSQPRGDDKAYSEGTARMETSPEFDKGVAEEKARQAMTAEQRRAVDSLNRDKMPQAEVDSR